MHAARHVALQQAARRIGGLAQQRQLAAKFIEQAGKAPRRGVIGGRTSASLPLRLHDQVDRTVLQMKPPAIGQKADLRGSRHARDPGAAGGEGI